MDRDEIIETLTGDVDALVQIDGEVNATEEIDGDVIAEGEIDGEVEVAKAYFKAASINGYPLDRDYTSEELDIEVLKAALDASRQVGGVNVGDHYDEGTMLEKIIRDMLNPVDYPRLVPPSASLSATGPKLLEKGDTLNTVVTVSFNRGLIDPAYGTDGYRSGPASMYYLNGGTGQASNSFFYTITESDDRLQAVVDYGAGDQPKNSIGEDYDGPYPAGSLSSSVIVYEFVNALWANVASIESITKQALVSKEAKVKEFTFPPQTPLFPEVFDVPGDWFITTIEVLNTLSGQWEDVSREFDISTVTHDDAAGVITTYKRYTDNRGYSAGSRTIRIKWS